MPPLPRFRNVGAAESDESGILAVLESLPMPLVLVRPEGVHENAAAARLAGANGFPQPSPVVSLIGRSAAVRAALRGRPASDEIDVSDGARVRISAIPVRDVNGNTAVVVLEDTSESAARSAVETAGDAILCADRSGVVVFSNPAAGVLFGRPHRDLVGKHISELVARRRRAKDVRRLTRTAVRAHDAPRKIDVRAARADGSVVPVEASIRRTARGRSTRYTAVVRDVGERVREQRELARSMREQARAMRRWEEIDEMNQALLHAVIHEFASPVAAVSAASHVLRSRLAEDPVGVVGQALRDLEGATNQMRRLLREPLERRRASGAVPEPARSKVDVRSLVLRVVGRVNALREHPVELAVPPLTAQIDESKVETIVENLVRNATVHTSAGTPVSISATADQLGLLLTVADRGPGVPRGMRREIFKPFRRGDARRPGLGIGLSLVARFARLHGGRAWVEDRTGGGAMFRVFLPCDIEVHRPHEGSADLTGHR
jgi:PAS domain S-box-containing protein